MTKHHPKHPERRRDVPPPPPPTTVERHNDGMFWLAVFAVLVPIAVLMAIYTSDRHIELSRPQDRIIAAPTAKTPEVMLHEQIAREIQTELKPSVDLPVEAPVVEAAPASQASVVVEPVSHTSIPTAAPAPSVRHKHHPRRRHYRRHRHHHASQFCLTPRPDGLEHDVASCITLDAARLGGLIQ